MPNIQHAHIPEELFCLEGCRSYAQYYSMRLGFEMGHCAFCPENFDLSKNGVFWEDARAYAWAVPQNFLRKELSFHFIIAPKRHVRFLWELSNSEALAMHDALVTIGKRYTLDTGGIIVTRFGDMRFNAGTVPHIHENIMVPNGTGEVRIPVFKDPHDREKNRTRASAFAMQYEAGEGP